MLEEVIQSPTQTVFQVAVQSLQELNLQITQIDNQNGVIRAITKASFWSGGEDILVQIRPDNYNTVIYIESKSKRQLIDFLDSNNKNEAMVLSRIKNSLGII